MKTRTATLDVGSFGGEKTREGLEFIRWEGATRKKFVIKFSTPSDAEWIARMSIEWLQTRRADVQRALDSVKQEFST